MEVDIHRTVAELADSGALVGSCIVEEALDHHWDSCIAVAFEDSHNVEELAGNRKAAVDRRTVVSCCHHHAVLVLTIGQW